MKHEPRCWRRCAAALITLLACHSTPAATSGAVVINDSAPDLAQRDRVYRVSLEDPALAGLNAAITTLYWRVELTPSQDIPRIELCVAGNCRELTMQRGSSEAFAGLPADSNIEFRFMVPGRGMLQRPIRGGQLQLIVNYRQPRTADTEVSGSTN